MVQPALAEGHSVVALARRVDSVPVRHPNLVVAKGDALDAESVKTAMRGAKAFICVLGLPLAASRKPTVLYSQGTRNILQAMSAHGLQRLIVVTGIGAGDSKGHGGFVYDRIIQQFLLNESYLDKDRQEAIIRATDLDWVIVRPGALTNGPERGNYRVITGGSYVAGKISCSDVAPFLLQQLVQDRYLRKAALISY